MVRSYDSTPRRQNKQKNGACVSEGFVLFMFLRQQCSTPAWQTTPWGESTLHANAAARHKLMPGTRLHSASAALGARRVWRGVRGAEMPIRKDHQHLSVHFEDMAIVYGAQHAVPFPFQQEFQNLIPFPRARESAETLYDYLQISGAPSVSYISRNKNHT